MSLFSYNFRSRDRLAFRASSLPRGSEADIRAVRRLDRIIWLLIAAIAVFVAITLLFNSFKIVWWPHLLPAVFVAASLVGAWFYRTRRNDEGIPSMLEGFAQLLAFTAVSAALQYVAASANLPLQDEMFAAADRWIGFDWKAALHWMNDYPSFHSVLRLIYLSFAFQVTIVLVALSMNGQWIRIRLFFLALILATVATIAISAVLPAQGAWGQYAVSALDHPSIVPATRDIHLSIFMGLRDGSYRLFMGGNSEGIITFPSLHAAFGLLFILTLWSVPVLRWISLTVNVLMIGATPIDGGHYLVDVIVGLILATLCWIAASHAAMRMRIMNTRLGAWSFLFRGCP